MTILNSPDIDVFDFKTIYDLSGTQPQVRLINLSSGDDLQNMSYWFELRTPANILYHQGTEAAPDIDGVWIAEHVITEPIPIFQGHIDWSGNDYEIVGFAKDSQGTVFTTAAYTTRIFRPAGNKTGQRNSYGAGNLSVTMNCATGKLTFEDISNYSYGGSSGYRVSKQVMLVFPPDNSNGMPQPFVVSDVNAGQVPIAYNGRNYQILSDAVYDYEFEANTNVRIRYKYKACFDITCGADLCSVICSYQLFTERLESDGCSASDREKHTRILSLFVRAIVGIMSPLCGVNLPKILSDLKCELGGCSDCEEISGGINPETACAVPVDLRVETTYIEQP